MMRPMQISQSQPDMNWLQARYLSLLPRIETHARICCRHIKCRHRRADFIAEAVALCWQWFVRLAQWDKEAADFFAALCRYAVRAVCSGQRVYDQERVRDVLSPLAQQQRGFAVGKLPDFSTLNSNPLQEALFDNRQTPIPDRAGVLSAGFPGMVANARPPRPGHT